MVQDVLVFTPVYRLEPETVQAVMAFEWPTPLSYLFQRDNPYKAGNRADGVANHLHQYKRGREAFLAGPYDAMLVIESDIIPPPDTLTRLAAVDADLVYGCYVFRNNRMPVVNIFERYRDQAPGIRARNVGESLTVRGLWPKALKQGVIDCSGAGLGCTLIKRHVLEAIDFHLEPVKGNRSPHCDTYFTQDVWRAGYEMKADARVLCGHKNPDGTILWPEGADAVRDAL